MVTFCLGSARQKRAYLATIKNSVLLDNIEVLFCASENGKNYFAIGDVPFCSFFAGEYLRYHRALCADAAVDALAALGINKNTRLKHLCPAQMRIVQFVEKTGGATNRPVVINLDGAKYSRKNKKALLRLLKSCGTAYVFVTDKRFLRGQKPDSVLSFGKPQRISPHFYRAKILAKRLKAKRVAVM